MRHDVIALALGALLLLGGCSSRDSRCKTTGNPRECARVIAAGGSFEDYRRHGLAGYQLSTVNPPRLYRTSASVMGRIASYDSAISRFEARELRRRNERQRRHVRNNVRRNKEAARRRRQSH